MTKDPRFQNETFDVSSIGLYLADYARTLQAALSGVDEAALTAAQALIEGASAAGRRIYAIGNGGSGARTEELKTSLVGIQRGRTADPHGWIHKVF